MSLLKRSASIACVPLSSLCHSVARAGQGLSYPEMQRVQPKAPFEQLASEGLGLLLLPETALSCSQLPQQPKGIRSLNVPRLGHQHMEKNITEGRQMQADCCYGSLPILGQTGCLQTISYTCSNLYHQMLS